MTDDIRAALVEFVAAKRREHAFLKLNGADAAGRRGEELMDQLEGLIETTPEREFTVEEAARVSGMHPKSIYRKVRRGEMGRQTGKGCTVVLSAGEVRRLHARTSKRTESGPAQRNADVHAQSLLTRL